MMQPGSPMRGGRADALRKWLGRPDESRGGIFGHAHRHGMDRRPQPVGGILALIEALAASLEREVAILNHLDTSEPL